MAGNKQLTKAHTERQKNDIQVHKNGKKKTQTKYTQLYTISHPSDGKSLKTHHVGKAEKKLSHSAGGNTKRHTLYGRKLATSNTAN